MKLSIRRRKMIGIMIFLDYFSAIAAWLVFWFYRQSTLHAIDPSTHLSVRSFNLRDYMISFLLVPALWTILYYLSGTYFDLYKKSRLHEIYRSLIISIIGCLGIGMVAFANDTDSFIYFFEITSWYFLTHIFFLLTSRLILLYKIKLDLIRNKIKYNTIIIGGNGKVSKVYNQIINNPQVLGNAIIGYVNVNTDIPINNDEKIKELGSIHDLESIINHFDIEEVIIAVESHEHTILEQILIRLSYCPVSIKVMPDLYDIISGSVRINNVYGPVLTTINPELLPDWQQVCKRVIDVFFSGFAIIVLFPLYIFSAIKVKLSSKGPVFYKQKRIGLFGNPFYIYKFRSMYIDAEKDGPLLSSDFDPRITKWGKFMRKWRVDELPQFFNILKGDMSLVGPRPERKHFINKIIQTHPHYKFLHRVKPGLTSWGMVQYGYAENVEEMIERMKFDLLYIENCSLALDVKIMIYTIKVILQGRGK